MLEHPSTRPVCFFASPALQFLSPALTLVISLVFWSFARIMLCGMLRSSLQTPALTHPTPASWVQGPEHACTARNLQPGHRYQVRVRARNAAGPGAHSRPAHFSTAANVPAPLGLPQTSQRGRDGLRLSWPEPQHDGGAPVQGFRLEMCAGAARPLHGVVCFGPRGWGWGAGEASWPAGPAVL